VTTDKIILKRNQSSALDVPMAALTALAVGFVAFAMPDALFTDMIVASGLPSMLPAAQPPLGMTARSGIAVPAAFGVFLATWLLLRSLNGAKPRPRREAGEIDAAPLRLRRADAHPDAPSRPPLIAGLELGEPEPAEEEAELWEPEIEADYVAEDPAESPLELEPPSLSELMQRLELGLVRRQASRAPAYLADEPEVEEPTAVEPSEVDERLQSALDGLRMMAARGA
jgi:hypothetical protein